ncbi:hypothetical protein [Neptuniibacter sp.]|uniref:hypothetical protein n=1 Tax=Neptuniibacter sp. TaxID=1962643 RepID=UPI003B5A4247
MSYQLKYLDSDSPVLEQFSGEAMPTDSNTVVIDQASSLLELYLDTDEGSALMPLLQQIRDEFLQDLDLVDSVKEIYGLIYWLLADNNIEHRGETLEETADRLGDLDIENDSDRYTDLIFHLKDAVERIYDIELE